MSDKVLKLNKLKNPESFIQINTVKGFKYVDKAGEILNLLHRDDITPNFKMGLDGLVVDNVDDHINNIKISPNVIWVRFLKIDTLDMISSIFVKKTEEILKIIEVQKVNRIGWRNYFIYEFVKSSDLKEFLKLNNRIKDGELTVLNTKLNTKKGFEASLTIQPVKKVEDENAVGILFDLDVYKEELLNVDQIAPTLKKFMQYMNDKDGFLSVVNNTFK